MKKLFLTLLILFGLSFSAMVSADTADPAYALMPDTEPCMACQQSAVDTDTGEYLWVVPASERTYALPQGLRFSIADFLYPQTASSAPGALAVFYPLRGGGVGIIRS